MRYKPNKKFKERKKYFPGKRFCKACNKIVATLNFNICSVCMNDLDEKIEQKEVTK